MQLAGVGLPSRVGRYWGGPSSPWQGLSPEVVLPPFLDVVIANFMCQLDWDMGCPDI